MKLHRNGIVVNLIKSLLIGAVAIGLEFAVHHFLGESATTEIIYWLITLVAVIWITLQIGSSS